MSIQSCYFCVQDEDKLWFWMCLRQVLTLCHFCLFLCCVLDVFNSPVVTAEHGLLGLNLSRWLRFISENASKLALYICATTIGFTSLSCQLRVFSLGLVTVHMFSFHVCPFAFILQVTWIKQYHSQWAFSRLRSRFTRAQPLEPELSYAIKYFLKHNSYQTEWFFKQWICIEHWTCIAIQWTVPFWE